VRYAARARSRCLPPTLGTLLLFAPDAFVDGNDELRIVLERAAGTAGSTDAVDPATPVVTDIIVGAGKRAHRVGPLLVARFRCGVRRF